MKNQVIQGDCLEVMKDIPDKSIDMILCDLPYGITRNGWDKDIVNIDVENLFVKYKRIIKDKGIICLFSKQPFTTTLMVLGHDIYRDEIIWEKSKATGYLNAKKLPLQAHENILIFSKEKGIYNPQFSVGKKYNKGKALRETSSYGKQTERLVEDKEGKRYPRSVIYFRTAESEGKLHPTQKPVALFEYLMKTYTNEGDLVLDNCAGSGTTGVACKNLGRNYILIEKEPEYIKIINERLISK